MSLARKRLLLVVALMFAISCAGVSREISSCNAGAFGSDWIVVQYDINLEPKACWKLINTSMSNEAGSDGIFWKDPRENHLVHLSGWYNRVQVTSGQWESAAALIGVDLNYCGNGKYPLVK